MRSMKKTIVYIVLFICITTLPVIFIMKTSDITYTPEKWYFNIITPEIVKNAPIKKETINSIYHRAQDGNAPEIYELKLNSRPDIKELEVYINKLGYNKEPSEDNKVVQWKLKKRMGENKTYTYDEILIIEQDGSIIITIASFN